LFEVLTFIKDSLKKKNCGTAFKKMKLVPNIHKCLTYEGREGDYEPALCLSFF
jgi:hypothetical protein